MAQRGAGIRFPQVVQGRDALRRQLVDLLEDDVGVRAVGQRYGRRRGQRCICLSAGLLYLLLRRRVPQRHGDRHAEGCLGLVDGAERALLVDDGGAPLALDVLAAPGLVAREGGDGEGRAGGRGRGMGGRIGGVGQRQRGRGRPPVRGRASGAG
jgi:hypothetical protein